MDKRDTCVPWLINRNYLNWAWPAHKVSLDIVYAMQHSSAEDKEQDKKKDTPASYTLLLDTFR